MIRHRLEVTEVNKAIWEGHFCSTTKQGVQHKHVIQSPHIAPKLLLKALKPCLSASRVALQGRDDNSTVLFMLRGLCDGSLGHCLQPPPFAALHTTFKVHSAITLYLESIASASPMDCDCSGKVWLQYWLRALPTSHSAGINQDSCPCHALTGS